MRKHIVWISLFLVAFLISDAISQDDDYIKLNFQNIERQYILYVPNVKKDAYPLVIVLHGAAGSGQKMKSHLGFDSYADKEGFVVAYPDAAVPLGGRRKSGQWNDGLGIFESSKRGIDDVGFILVMIEDISRKVPLDRSRIYVAGLSNGGMMTYRLGCQASGTFAAIATVAANMAESVSKQFIPQGPISFLSVNGGDDKFVPLRRTEARGKVSSSEEKIYILSRKESVLVFAKANGCDEEFASEKLPAEFNDGTSVIKITYNNCQLGSEVVSYIIYGMGHGWPSGLERAAVRKTTKNLDATKEIVEFFLRHHK